ncbi:uncharacterized protein [Solanum tuberosum]|uniref:uncharacterized protein isoform X2 n=1 Tax=Solanum tuberosum TaxID=4113 RepID=UPI0003D264F7|nr:PREDICTED: uncharacterized protein LOC102601227 isoform X2 [Solanum tuberosum]
MSSFTLNVGMKLSWPIRDVSRQQIQMGNVKIMACVSDGSTPSQSSFLSRSQTYALLKQQMDVAAKSEDYKEAARLRDSLKIFEDQEPVLRLQRLVKEAIAQERFEDAARYRDELKDIAPHSLLKCSSEATTLGIRVQVRSVYIEGRSQPSKGLYFFAYRIRITNNSDRPVQLLRRHWIITDANGKTENVWGIGVIGEQPVVLPNTAFEYSSACPLGTPSGRMVHHEEEESHDLLILRTNARIRAHTHTHALLFLLFNSRGGS